MSTVTVVIRHMITPSHTITSLLLLNLRVMHFISYGIQI